MAFNENKKIKCIFLLFIIVAILLFICRFNKPIIEGNTSMTNTCNDCQINPGKGSSLQSLLTGVNMQGTFKDCVQLPSGSPDYLLFVLSLG